jgi:hypothetical protein
VYPDQFVQYGQPDYYQVDVLPGQLMSLALHGLTNPGTTTAFAWLAPDCGFPTQFQGWSFLTTEGRLMHLYNPTGAVQTYNVEVSATADFSQPTSSCGNYDLRISVEQDPCGIFTQSDAFEPNDICGAAAPIAAGVHELKFHKSNNDWFSLDVGANATLTLAIDPQQHVFPVSHLSDACGGQFLAAGSQPNAGDPYTVLSWTNPDPTPRSVVFFVIYPVYSPDFCSDYELLIQNTVGEIHCSSTPNTTGAAALIRAEGSLDVSTGSLALVAQPIPSNQFGLFFFGANEIAPAALGNGFRCIGSPFIRLPIGQADASGRLSFTIDWNDPGPAGAITSGSTFSFQAWFRDPTAAGATYDASDAVRVTFN